MIPKVIIGANYGDEGKGATVNYLATKNSTVVRFNGGCQAGHTVVENGVRHVFSSFGSGTLKGASTHLSRFFVFSPGPFLQERKALVDLGIEPKVSIAPECLITLPIDVAINQTLEEKRGKDRHGSVGVGFGETVERSKKYPLQVYELFQKNLRIKINEIYNQWLPTRCLELGLSFDDVYFKYDKNRFIEDCYQSANYFTIIHDAIICANENLIFEGAQGLMLDEDYGVMPYCTPSSCGLKNIGKLIPNQNVEAYYVSRPYFTRHGTGPLLHEDIMPEWVVDKTNVANKYQGNLRFGYLDWNVVKNNIKKDITTNYNINVAKTISVITCMDQIPIAINIYINNMNLELYKYSVIELFTAIASEVLIHQQF